MMSKINLFGFLLILCSFQLIDCYNILFMLPFGSRSHKNVFDPIAEELGKRGHKVVIFSSVEEKSKDPPGVQNHFAREMFTHFESLNVSFFQGTMGSLSMITDMFKMIYSVTDLTFKDPFINDLLSQPIDSVTKKPKFDVVVIDAVFNDFALAFGHHLGVPNIILSPSSTFHHHAWNLDIPYPISYIPSFFSDYPDPMDFVSRASSSFSTLLFTMLMNHIVLPNELTIIHKYLPNTPSLIDLNKNVSFMLSNTHPGLHLRKPNMPYSAEVGGLNCKEAKPLPKDLEDFMQSAGKDGVIYFSLGSVTRGDSMPLDMRGKVLEVFAKLPQKILWKYEKDVPNLPKNVKLIKWAPQQDLLANSNLRLFITHGGLLSISEANYHGTPILGFPLSADQLGNMVQVRKQGVGEYLEWKTFTAQEFLEKINKLINDKSYKENTMFASMLLKDRITRPVDAAVYWIEYVVRHKGAPFLKSSASHLNFFQYFLLDVIAVVLGILAFALTILFYLIKFTCKLVGGICHAIGFCKKTVPKKSKNKKKNN